MVCKSGTIPVSIICPHPILVNAHIESQKVIVSDKLGLSTTILASAGNENESSKR